jgi:chromate transporter
MSQPADAPAPYVQPPALWDIFLLFCRVGLTSFGGGTSAWLFREIVHKRRWLPEDEFINVMALCQALPGVNVSNIAVWIGRKLFGLRGAVVAVMGIIALPSVAIVLIAMLFAAIAHNPLTEIVLTGATAAAIGLPFSMGIMMAQRVRRAMVPLLVMLATFAAIGILKLPLIWVVLICGAASVIAESLRREPG